MFGILMVSRYFENRSGACGSGVLYRLCVGHDRIYHARRLLRPPVEHPTQNDARHHARSSPLYTAILSKRSLIVAQRLYVYSVSYTASMGFAKAAILLEWKRIFVPRGTRDAFFWTAMALLVINVLLYLSVEIVVICSCVPPRKFWYPFIAGPCVNRRIVDTTAGAFNLATDIAIFLLPQRKIWSLRLSTSRKIGLAIVFSFGLVYVNISTPAELAPGTQL